MEFPDLADGSLDQYIQELKRSERMNFSYYKPHPKQLKFHLLGKTAFERLFLAGNRTGKSLSGSKEGSMHVMGCYPEWWDGKVFNQPITLWVLGVTNEQVRTTLQQYYIGDRATGRLGAIHPDLILKQTNKAGSSGGVDTVYVRHSSGGISTIHFKSYQQGREALQSAKVDVIHADEEPPYGIYTELLMRLMSVGGEQGIMMITATPLLGMTKVVHSFLSSNDIQISEGVEVNGKAYVQAGWNDNPHLLSVEKERLRTTLSPHEIECREKGIPALGAGMVYPVSEKGISCDPFEIPNYWPRFFGLDFGWNCTAAIFGAHDVDNDVVYFYAEYAKGQLTPEVHARDLLKMGADWIPGAYDPAGLQSDQQDGTNFARIYASSGMKYLIKADNSKEAGITAVLTRMQNGQLKIFNTLHGTFRELRMHARGDDGKAKKGNDHLMDAMRYAVMSGIKVGRKKNLNINRDDYYSNSGGYGYM